MLVDINSFAENGIIYSPDQDAVIKDGFAYTQDPYAQLDQSTGNYLTLVNP